MTAHERASGFRQEPVLSIPDGLPKRRGHSGRAEVHCLEDACILVRKARVSDNTASSKSDSSKGESHSSDLSLVAYAETAAAKSRHERESVVVQVPGRDVECRYYEEESVTYFDQESYRKEQEDPFAVNECVHFMDHVSFAKELVSHLVDESEAKVELESPKSISKETVEEEEEEQQRDVDNEDRKAYGREEKYDFEQDGEGAEGFRSKSCEFDYVETKKTQITWPTIEAFSIELGAYTIDEYLSYFDTEEDWMYVIYFQGTAKSECSDLHKYQAIYSLPTWKYPVAQATASIYFTIEVCKAKPPQCLVDVTYRYETFRKLHRPGVLDFQEKWLNYILDSKIKFFQTITY